MSKQLCECQTDGRCHWCGRPVSERTDEITRLRAEVERMTKELAATRSGQEFTEQQEVWLAEERDAIRLETIERCKKVCDELAEAYYPTDARDCAAAIRALK